MQICVRKCVITYHTNLKSTLYIGIFNDSIVLTRRYWPVWARQVAVFLQQGALLVVPFTAFTQTWRYMNKGPPDIFDVSIILRRNII